MHRLVAAILAGVLVHSASARDLQIRGVAGYLSEYELSADVAQRDGEAGALSGPLTVRHVGVCTHARPGRNAGPAAASLHGAAQGRSKPELRGA